LIPVLLSEGISFDARLGEAHAREPAKSQLTQRPLAAALAVAEDPRFATCTGDPQIQRAAIRQIRRVSVRRVRFGRLALARCELVDTGHRPRSVGWEASDYHSEPIHKTILLRGLCETMRNGEGQFTHDFQ
jgi:hypothetical protein